ncbi:MAG: PilZ domain-containing protein [bacterium]
MGQDVEGILKYFKGSTTGIYDYVIIILLLLFLALIAFLALREVRLRKIAGDDEAFRRMKKPPHRVIKWRQKKGIGVTTSRRHTPRLEKTFTVDVSSLDGTDRFQAEILDISAGGVRLILFDPTDEIVEGIDLDVTASEPPLDIIGTAKMKVMKLKPGEEAGTLIVNGQWSDIDRLSGKALAREVRHQLNIMAEEEWEKEKAAGEGEEEKDDDSEL